LVAHPALEGPQWVESGHPVERPQWVESGHSRKLANRPVLAEGRPTAFDHCMKEQVINEVVRRPPFKIQ
jgi:hypothetical protein